MRLHYDPEEGTIQDRDDPVLFRRVAFLSRQQAEAHPKIGDLMAAGPELLDTVKRLHGVIDLLFARMIQVDGKFLPSKSGEPWDAVVAAHQLVKRLEE